MKMLMFLFHLLVVVFLTALTQVGGIVYLLALIIAKKLELTKIKATGVFAALYLLAALVLVPLIAPMFGRTALPLSGNLRPLNIGTCLLNRHYVKVELKKQLISIAQKMNSKNQGTKTNYLDGNFPFFDGFPLFPHLSHNDGRKVDLAFYYTNVETGKPSDSAPSFIGYGIFDGPTDKEPDYPGKCANQGYWQYGAISYVVPQWNAEKLKVDSQRTSQLIQLLATHPLTSKIFIEPHLKQRWDLNSFENIRFHGCQAVRHDDHIHIQI